MIKGLIFRIIMFAVISAGIMSYLASSNGIDIRQFLPTFERPQLPNFTLPSMPDIKLPSATTENTSPATISKIYQWRGADGSWHFSENLPEGVNAEKTLFFNAEANVVQGLPTADPTPIAGNNKADNHQTRPTASPATNLNPYSTQAIEKLLDDARGVQEVMNQRTRDLEQVTEGL